MDITEVMTLVGLKDAMNKKVGKYSMGMRQRLGIAQAIMEYQQILILDEPMNGLDNQGVEGDAGVIDAAEREGNNNLTGES